MRRLRWPLTATLGTIAVTCAFLAARRPYADNQRSWLLGVAVLATVLVLAPALLRLLAAGTRAVLAEWTRSTR